MYTFQRLSYMSLIILHLRPVRSYFSHLWLILEVFFLFEAPPFWYDVFILGHSHFSDFWRWDLTSCLWMLLSMDYRDDDILGSVSSAHLVRRGYPCTYVTHLYILPLTPLYLHPSHFARALLIFHFESTFFYHAIGSYLTLLIREEDVGQFWVFWLSVRIPLDIRFSIFHDGRAY